MLDADALRDAARGVRHDIVAELPELLEGFADRALDRGTHVCWASTAAEARDHVARVIAARGATPVVTSASAVIAEVDVDAMLAARGVGVVETGLGEWIAGLADEVPAALLDPAHPDPNWGIRDLLVERAQARPHRARPDELVRFARERRRSQLLGAEVGVVGADLAVAATGSIVLVAPEGDGRLLPVLPPVLVVVLGLDRLTATWDQADLLLAVEARSATGQRRRSSTTVLTGPRADREAGGPEEIHVVVLDNGRSRLLAEPEATLGALAPALGTALGCSSRSAPALPAEFGLVGALPAAAADPEPGPIDVPRPALPLGTAGAAHPHPHPRDRAEQGERAAWRLWATAWSDARRYSATTRPATWGRWVTRVAGHLPGAASWAPDGEPPAVASERFRDRWWKGQV